jgi:hypothetical protein
MAKKPPSFGALRKAKPAPDPAPQQPAQAPATAPAAVKDARIQTSVRLDPVVWGALNDLATRLRVETGDRVTMHDLLTQGALHILASHGIKIPR